MATVLLGISDPHWTEYKPRSRKDKNWLGTVQSKIQKLLLLATRIQVEGEDKVGADAIQIAGDLFHVPEGPSIARRLDTKLAQELVKTPCPIYTIPGNHDLQNERIENLPNHPYGVMVASGLVHDLCWPKYTVVGDDPPVILIGYPYVSNGPGAWLSELAASGELHRLKESVGKQHNKHCYVSAMTHNHWGTVEGQDEHFIQRTAKSLLLGTGIDVCHYGDPHTFDGVEWLQDKDHRVALVGPGAFIRGTLAEHDISRKPMIAVMVFRSNQEPEIKMVPVPHQPAEEVFNLERHRATRTQRQVTSQFFDTIRSIKVDTPDIAGILKRVNAETSPRVLDIVQQALTRATEGTNEAQPEN